MIRPRTLAVLLIPPLAIAAIIGTAAVADPDAATPDQVTEAVAGVKEATADKVAELKADDAAGEDAIEELTYTVGALEAELEELTTRLDKLETTVARAKVRGTSSGAPARADLSAGDPFDRLARCESGGNPATNTGNGYFGAFQFDRRTWAGLGLSGVASDHPYAVQKDAARRLQAARGWTPWPTCARKLGLN